MVKRKWWLKRIYDAWKYRSIIWLSGVRRAGKTFLCKSIPGSEYFDCELPRVRRLMDDPEAFLNEMRGRIIIFDEIHRLPNPSEILKIAADHYQDIKIISTGSSTLGASAKFRDTLTGRKAEIWLTPMTSEDLKDFGNTDIRRRLLYGGLPPFFLSDKLPERDFQEWCDAYWAKDVQELFRLEKRHSFYKFFELLMSQSGGIFDATRFAMLCESNRSTISNYLSVLEETFVVHVVRPFSSHRSSEIISAPKVYAFDTGFVCYWRGWLELRNEDMGYLWEHYVLNELHSHLQARKILYWRDKRGHEIDFVLPGKRKSPLAIECKWSVSDFEIKNLRSFRNIYPSGDNIVVARDVDRGYTKSVDGIIVKFLNLKGVIDLFAE
jgi:predicted AAA+ superfamily ATPase